MRLISCAIVLAAAYGCDNETQVTQPSEARSPRSGDARYSIEKLRSLGGAQSRGMAINDRGRVAGWSNLPDGSRRAAWWTGRSIHELPTLGGPSSTVPWPGQNNTGMIVGVSQTDKVDPLDEEWACELGGFLPETTNLICRGFVWENNRMRELPTLGGNHGFAAGVNDQGQIVGWAETPLHDDTCSPTATQVLQFRAVLWEPKRGDGNIPTRELSPYGDHSTSAATAINDKGQAVGISGDCDQGVGRFSAREAVLWEKDGNVTRIPNLGGTSWHTPMDINEGGDVVGFSNPDEPGDEIGDFISRAFFWPSGAAKANDLGTLGDDPVSEAFAINSRRQVVGISFGDLVIGPRAFLWENDVLTDLNDLVDISPDTLLSAQDINDAGQITGRVRDHASREVLTFVATPIQGKL
jgi:probable HAF family extracellular repeat protein